MSPAPERAAPTTLTKAQQERQYRADVLQAAEQNHIWLNAFACIRPTDEFLQTVGRQVLDMLACRENTHQSRSGYLLDLPQPEVVIRVNKS